jgi:hypothetical protein
LCRRTHSDDDKSHQPTLDVPAAVRTFCDDPSPDTLQNLPLAVLALITEIIATDTEHLPDVDTARQDKEEGLERRLTAALLHVASTAALDVVDESAAAGVTTTGPNRKVVSVFAVASSTSITMPADQVERYDRATTWPTPTDTAAHRSPRRSAPRGSAPRLRPSGFSDAGRPG